MCVWEEESLPLPLINLLWEPHILLAIAVETALSPSLINEMCGPTRSTLVVGVEDDCYFGDS